MDPLSSKLDTSVLFWGKTSAASAASVPSSYQNIKDANKTKQCCMHPCQPWIISVDRRQVISVWDYKKKSVLCQKHISELIPIPKQNESAPSKSSNNALFHFLRYKSFDGSGSSCSHLDDKESVPVKQQANVQVPTGDVKKVAFADRQAVMFSTGSRLPLSRPSYHNDSRIVILTDNMLIFYDFVSSEVKVLSVNDLGKAQPTSCEIIANNLCAVGCSDGHVRIIDLHTFKLVADLIAHSKTEICLVQNIPVSRNFNMAPCSSAEAPFARFLSAGIDNSAFIWLIRIVNGQVYKTTDGPIAPLATLKKGLCDASSLSGVLTSVHFDEMTDTLFTITGNDRVVRLWDLEIFKDIQKKVLATTRRNSEAAPGPGGPEKKTSRRMSFFGGVIEERETAELALKCIDTWRAGKGLSSILKKFSSCSSIPHPIFSPGSFVACNKTRIVAILQSMDAETSVGFTNKSSFSGFKAIRSGSSVGGSVATGEYSQSERNSVVVMDEKTKSLFLLHELFIPALLDAYASQLVDERYVAAESYQDALENLRVYDVVVNPLCPTVLGLATSAGVLVLSFLSRAPLGRVVGIHQLYGEMALTYSEGSLHRMLISCATPDDSGSPEDSVEGGVFPDSLEEKVDSLEEKVIATEQDATQSIQSLAAPSRSLVGGLFGKQKEENSNFPPSKTSTNSLAPLPLPITSLIGTSKPIIMPSHSGEFCILHWTQSQLYVVFRVKPAGISEDVVDRDLTVAYSSSASKCLSSNIVDRGMCNAIAWASSDEPIYCLILPPTKKEANKRKSMFSWSSIDSCLNTQIVRSHFAFRKLVQSESSGVYSFMATDLEVELPVVSEGRVSHQITGAVNIFGGPLLCVNAPWSTTVDTVSLEYNMRGRFYSLISTGENVYKLVGVGPIMKQVVNVQWDPTSLQCAVLIGSRINIMSISETTKPGVEEAAESKPSFTLSSIGSVHIACTCCSLGWLPDTGMLFVCSYSDIYLVCTDYPYLKGLQPDSSADLSICRADVLHIATTSHTAIGQSSASRYMYCKPIGWLEVVGIRGSSLILTDAEGRFSSFPFVFSSRSQKTGYAPLLMTGIALGLGLRNEALIECIKMAPINMHDTICSMLIRRGCATEALALTGLSFDRLIECIVRFDLKQNAIEVFESIARSEYLSLDSPSSAITLLLYLAHSGLLPGGRSAYAGFVKRYARCHDDISLALLHESIIASKRAGTKTIELPPVFSGLLSDIII